MKRAHTASAPPIILWSLVCAGALYGCGTQNDWPSEGSATHWVRVVLDETAIPSDLHDMVIESDYTGELQLYVFEAWPPWDTDGAAGNYVDVKELELFHLPPQGSVLRVFVPAGPHWLTAFFTPATSEKFASAEFRGRQLGTGLDQLSSTGLCTLGCDRSDDTCTRKCAEPELGKGIPYVYFDPEKEIGPSPTPMITIRINDQLNVSDVNPGEQL